MSGDPEIVEPVGWCIIGEGDIWSASTLEEVKQQVKDDFLAAQFIEDCGWVLAGEETSLLEPDNQEILAFHLALKNKEELPDPEVM